MRLSRLSLSVLFASLLAFVGLGCSNRIPEAVYDLEPFFPDNGLAVNEQEPPAVCADPSQIPVFGKLSNGVVVRVLGVESESPVCCLSSRQGRLDCFIRGPWSNVLHMHLENGEYSDWEDLGGGSLETSSALAEKKVS